MTISSLFCSASSRITIMNRSREEVYVAATPLRASKGPAQLLMSAAYSMNVSWYLQHFMVIVKSSSPPNQAIVYDFQPEDPEDISVAIAALSGAKVSGVVLVRKLGKIPKRKCWFVGYTKEDTNAADTARTFNENWDTQLRIGHHDCRNYTDGLVEYLTGDKAVLENLRQKQSN